MGWVKAKWIPPLFAAFNSRWPNRTRAQDGTIGDAAHQASTSGHNPDDTPGSRAERSDADSIPEVRAADVDARGVPMQQVIDGILADPNERKRFIYIIFNGWEWRAANNWRREVYGGADKHREHAHFSGDPAYDEDSRPFTTITNQPTTGGGAMTDWESLHDPSWNEPPAGDGEPRPLRMLLCETWDTLHTRFANTADKFPNSIPAALKRQEVLLLAIAAKVDIDEAELSAIQEHARLGAAAAVAAGAAQMAAAVIAGVRDELGEGPDAERIAAATEAAVRRVLGGLDGAVPPPTS